MVRRGENSMCKSPVAAGDKANAELDETNQGDADWKNKRIKLKTRKWAPSQGGVSLS